jgi:DNA-directed RNA polymerase subunit beta'
MNKALKKKEISKLINASFRKCGLKATVVFADKLLQNGFRLATRRHLDRHRRHAGAGKSRHPRPRREGSQGDRAAVRLGLVTAGERYNKVVDIWGKAGDEVSKVMMDQLKSKRPPTATARKSIRSRSTPST